MALALNTTWMLSVIGTVGNCQHIHTTHYQVKNVAADSGNLISAWLGAPYTAYRAMFCNEDNPTSLLKQVAVCGALPLPAGTEVSQVPGPASGTRAAGAQREPSFVAASVREMTALAGRSYRGRFFIGGLQDGDVVLNDLAGAYITLVNAYNTALMATFGPAGSNANWALVVHSRKIAATGADCTASATLVTSLTTSSRVTTMRSRKLGHGI